MNINVLRAWANFARNGDVRQGKEYESYWVDGEKQQCCIFGVLGKLYELETGQPIFIGTYGAKHAEAVNRKDSNFKKWLGVKSMPDLETAPFIQRLTALNDQGVGFDVLANMIDEEADRLDKVPAW